MMDVDEVSAFDDEGQNDLKTKKEQNLYEKIQIDYLRLKQFYKIV